MATATPQNPLPAPNQPDKSALVAWARETLDIEAFLREVDEARAEGGVEIHELLTELSIAVGETTK